MENLMEEGQKKVDLPELCADLSLLELWYIGLGPGRIAVGSGLLEALAEVEKLESVVRESFDIPRQVVVAVWSGGGEEEEEEERLLNWK